MTDNQCPREPLPSRVDVSNGSPVIDTSSQRVDSIMALAEQMVTAAAREGFMPGGFNAARTALRAALTATPAPGVEAVRLAERDPFLERVSELREKAEMPWRQAVELAASEIDRPLFWVLECGAVSLPDGHPSRLTTFFAYDYIESAIAMAEECGFDSNVYPVRLAPPSEATLAKEEPRQPLTEEEIMACWEGCSDNAHAEVSIIGLARAIERAHCIPEIRGEHAGGEVAE